MLLAALLFAAAPADAPPPPGVADLVAGAEACATGRQNVEKMTARLAGLGWTLKTAATSQKGLSAISLFERNGVTLTYFWSKPMAQCIASTDAGAAIDVPALRAALTAKFGKEPKDDKPMQVGGTRFYYFYSGLGILTVQVKPRGEGRTIELGVVH